MAANRYRPSGGRTKREESVASATAVVERGAKSIVVLGLVAGVLIGLGYMGWSLVKKSAYFSARNIEVEATAHLTRNQIIALSGVDESVNVLMFDTDAAVTALEAHPWIAEATVSKSLPDTVSIRIQERTAAGVLVFDAQYLIDEEGQIFARVEPGEVPEVPLITGLTREEYESEPVRSRRRVVSGLALARLYAIAPMSKDRPLSDVALSSGGRTELIVGRTRVALGRGARRKQLSRLQQIFDELGRRKLDAEYVLLADDGGRAIVKETALRRTTQG